MTNSASPFLTTSALPNTWPLESLFQLSRRQLASSQFLVDGRTRAGRYFVEDANTAELSPSRRAWFAQPTKESAAFIGDAPQQLHPRFVMAILSSRNTEKTFALRDFPIPIVEFSTLESVRRSITLNSMRMSLEYFQNGSLRVLELVENRLDAQQRDVVHDLCVYLMRHLSDIRAHEREARFLRAESVAAFLGLNEKQVQQLFLARHLSATAITKALENGFAGTIRRALDVEALIAAQIALLRPQWRCFTQEEEQLFALLDAVVERLRA